MTNKTEKSGTPDQQSRRQSATSTASSWIEVVRPFVAMAYGEWIKALAKEAAQHIPRQASAVHVQDARTLAESDRVDSSDERRSRDFRYPQIDEDSNGMHASGLQVEAAPEADHYYVDGTGDEPGRSAEIEVQPLFDPKLPPSANSGFKPTIGVIDTQTDEFQDLQQRYPQLHLILVLPNAVRCAGNLRDCQRIIGVRENVPSATDQYLRNTFRNRYVRIAGGIEHMTEQLDSWLYKPGSIDSVAHDGARRYNGKFHGHGRGQENEVGYGGNRKRYSRYPRAGR